MRNFVIRRTFAQYGDRAIVCDRCHARLHRSHYYEVLENGRLANIYPFHNLDCCHRFLERSMYDYEYTVDIEPGSEGDPFQEEVTE